MCVQVVPSSRAAVRSQKVRRGSRPVVRILQLLILILQILSVLLLLTLTPLVLHPSIIIIYDVILTGDCYICHMQYIYTYLYPEVKVTKYTYFSTLEVLHHFSERYKVCDNLLTTLVTSYFYIKTM